MTISDKIATMKKGADSGAGMTRVALVLDCSGSMQSIQSDAIKAFNEAIERLVLEARQGSGATITLITFNHQVRTLLDNTPADQARKLQPGEYQPGGTTALLDAVGESIDRLESPGPLGDTEAALVMVITDGMENASRKLSRKDLVERMQALEQTGAWTFSFMCANVDITDLSRDLGIDRGGVAAWTATSRGAADMASDVRDGMTGYFMVRGKGGKAKKVFWKDLPGGNPDGEGGRA